MICVLCTRSAYFFHFFHSLENLSIHSITHVCVNISDGVIFFSATDIDDLNEQLRGDRQQIQQVIEIIYMLWMVELSLDYFCCFSPLGSSSQ